MTAASAPRLRYVTTYPDVAQMAFDSTKRIRRCKAHNSSVSTSLNGRVTLDYNTGHRTHILIIYLTDRYLETWPKALAVTNAVFSKVSA